MPMHNLNKIRKLKYKLIYSSTQSRIIGAVRGGPLSIMGGQLSLYVPYMLPVSMTGDLAHLQLSHLQGENRSICRTSDLQGERMLIFRT